MRASGEKEEVAAAAALQRREEETETLEGEKTGELIATVQDMSLTERWFSLTFEFQYLG